MSSCPACGAPAPPSDVFCQKCGTRLGPAPGYYPYYPPVAPPHENYTALIIVVVVVVLVLAVALPAILYVMVSGLLGQPAGIMPRAMGVAVSQSPDGSNWMIAFTFVPTGLTQSGTTLTLLSASGATILPATALSSLEGAGLSGVRYVPLTSGTAYCAAGDQVLVAVGPGTNQYPAGTQYMFVNGGSILASGTLQ